MSLQVCHCGWSGTTYHGLRTHQGKMGCTPKGMRIPESQQVLYQPEYSFLRNSIKLEEPLFDLFSQPFKTDLSLQVCHCGWSSETTYHGLRTHQGKMGCTPKGMRIPETQQVPYVPTKTWTEPAVKLETLSSDIFNVPVKNGENTIESTKEKKTLTHSDQFFWGKTTDQNEKMFKEENLLVTNPTTTEAKILEIIKSMAANQDVSPKTGKNVDKTPQMFDFIDLFSPAKGSTVEETNQTLFQTPPRPAQTSSGSDKTRRALDFSTGEQQMEKIFEPLTTSSQERIIPKKEEHEKLKEAQRLMKVRRDRMKAELQQKINIRENKVAEVKSSVKTCKGSLDAEWLEINNIFSEVIQVVEDARQKALQPLEQRRQKVKKEAKDLIQKLQKEIDAFKKTMDELDKNPDMQVSPGPDLKNVTIDTSFSFGSLQTTTSTMMKRINKKLEKLSSLELKRISSFAVDVKLDPQSAHQSLILSDDCKKVRDGGMKTKLPDAPERFDVFGSVLGTNRLTSGKSYWEVEVRGKTGWDLGVTRRDANRKGKLSLSPEHGYWVTVHYEGEKFAALTEPPTSLNLKDKPQRVGVFVDYDEGLVSFYDVTTKSHIYSFTRCRFGGEIVPYFSPHLKLNEKNTEPLVICAV